MRLTKYLAHAGVASRRAAEEIVRTGKVTVAGEIVLDPAREVQDSSDVAVDGRLLKGAEATVVYVVNKPVGVVSTAKDTHGRPTVIELVADEKARLYPVGRLDADTSGLLLLTNDGELAHRLTHPSFEVPKTYRARVRGAPVSEAALGRLREGVHLKDGMTAPARVRQLQGGVLELTIHEGRNRQVRRMCEAVGHRVIELERIAFGALALGRLPSGAHRRLEEAELQRLNGSSAKSSGRAAVNPARGPSAAKL